MVFGQNAIFFQNYAQLHLVCFLVLHYIIKYLDRKAQNCYIFAEKLKEEACYKMY